MIRQSITPEQRAFIIDHYAAMPLTEIAATLNLSWKVVRQKVETMIRNGILARENRCYGRPWSEDDEDYLNEHWGILTDAEIATTLRRSLKAIGLRAYQLGVAKTMNVLSANAVAEIFGVGSRTVLDWAARGWIDAKRSGTKVGRHRAVRGWHVEYESLERFVVTMGWAYEYRSMAEGDYLTNLAKETQNADPWLTLSEVSAIIGRGEDRTRAWCHQGILPYRWRPRYTKGGSPHGVIVVRRVDIPAALERYISITAHNRSEAAKNRHAA